MATASFFGISGPDPVGNIIEEGLGEFKRQRNAESEEVAYRRDVAQSDSDFIRNAALQREFAQMGLRWKVEDAKAAGIHPLYALGGQGAMASPISVGQPAAPSGPGAWGTHGQDLSRANFQMQTPQEREFAVLQLQRMKLENKLLESQIPGLGASQYGPPLPSATDQPGDGLSSQGNAVRVQPQRPSASSPSNPARDAGAVADFGLVRTSGGGYAVVPSKDVKERIEDTTVPEAMWAFRNQIRPIFSGAGDLDPREYPLPKGYDRWEWQPHLQEYRAVKDRRGPKLIDWGRRGLKTSVTGNQNQ